MNQKRFNYAVLAMLALFVISCKKETVQEKTVQQEIAWHDQQTVPVDNPLLRSSSDNLAMGNPSGAVTNTANYTNYLLVKTQYTMSYHRDRGEPNWVSWHLDPTWLGSTPRQDNF